MTHAAGAAGPVMLPGSPPARYWALAHAVNAERDRRIRLAILLSAISGLVAVFALGASILPDAVSGSLLAGYLVYLGVQGAVLALALLRLSGGPYRKAQLVGEFARRATYEDWRRATGEAAPPLSPEAAARWLENHPGEDQLTQRLHALNVGDRAGAYDSLARHSRETAQQRYSHASDAWFLAFLDGSDAEPHDVESLAAELPDPGARARAVASVATLRASLLAARGGDWVTALAAAYPAVDGRISDDWRIPNVLRVWTMTMAASSVLLGVAWLAMGWLGLDGLLFGA